MCARDPWTEPAAASTLALVGTKAGKQEACGYFIIVTKFGLLLIREYLAAHAMKKNARGKGAAARACVSPARSPVCKWVRPTL